MRLKRGLLAGIALCCMPLMTACSAKDTIGILVGNNSEDTKKEEVTVDLNAANIDDSVEKPQITSEMGDPVTYDLHATADALTVEATVSEGTLSYQWYRNNVDSNGGGTAIDGATEATYTPPTTESGTIYYYVVVTNTVGDGVQLTASGTKCVTITEQEAAPEETGDTQEETTEETTEEALPEAGSRPMETGGIRMRTELIQPAAGRKLTVSGMYLTRTDISVPVGIRKEISGIISRKTVQWHMIRM